MNGKGIMIVADGKKSQPRFYESVDADVVLPSTQAESGLMSAKRPTKITLISLHGLIRAHEPELGRDSDTGGQTIYVLELAKELASHQDVESVELLTRQVIDPKISSDYAAPEEEIAENAKIIRIPFGPKRYLRKESLWPYIEMFVDQTLVHFKRNGIPDLIHAHYADAGLAGAQLARLLHVPFVFTGHSLGRVKEQRLSLGKSSTETLERKYKFRQRYEAEEMALETASLVVTSTTQEVEDQYSLYHHYQPDRMEVIPPGVDLSKFAPPGTDWDAPKLRDAIGVFLREPEKPFILTLARPDERKNLEKLVEVYGSSPELQKVANLVMLMGCRDDLRSLPKSQQDVINNVLYLIDKYDLYGKIAYPKMHAPEDVANYYRLATSQKGVFVNPAFTEPFGLTLLEAGATGLPIVATNDGGPRDILANCNNGLLVDPVDDDDIERALLRVLTEEDEWHHWSANGVAGTREHYSWSKHAQRYLRDVREILQESPQPTLLSSPKARRLPEFDRIVMTDLDNTLTGDPDALSDFMDLLADNQHIGFGIATGRTRDDALQLIEELGLPKPDILDSDAGTQLHYGEHLTPDLSWRKQIGFAWKPQEIYDLLDEIAGLERQEEGQCSEYKISYLMDTNVAPSLQEIKKSLRSAGIRAKVILSLGAYLDIVPVRGGSDCSVRHLLWKWGFSSEKVLVAGDSGNDAGMLLGRTLGVVVANHGPELDRLRDRPRVYFANAAHARGIIEGIEYYHFLDNIVIPNEKDK